MEATSKSVEKGEYVSSQVILERDITFTDLPKAITDRYPGMRPFLDETKKIHVYQYEQGEIYILWDKPRANEQDAKTSADLHFIDVIDNKYAGYIKVKYAVTASQEDKKLPYVGYTFTSGLEGAGLATRRLLAAGKFCENNLGEPPSSGKGYDDMTVRRIWEKLVEGGVAELVNPGDSHEFRFKKSV